MPDQAGSSRRTTIRDVAERAGVSIGTASKALNGKGKLKADTRHRVALAAEQLKFAPSHLARGLVEGRTYTIGLITNDRFGRLCGPVMLGAEDALGASQISAIACDSRDDPVKERQQLEALRRRAVDGMIIIGHRIVQRPSMSAGLGVPVIYALTHSLDANEPAVIPPTTSDAGMRVR